MTRIKNCLVGTMTIGVIVCMAGPANAQLFRRSESREQRTQPQTQYQGQPQYQRESQQYQRESQQYQREPQYQRESQYQREPQYQRGETRYEGSERHSSQSMSHARNRRISAVIGATARGPNGEHLGRVEDLIASDSGCIDYAIVSFSGLPGLSNKFAAIPWTVADLDMSQRVVTLDIDRERIRQAPIFFDRTNWPDLYERDWAERVSEFFGVEVVSDTREQGSDRSRSESRANRSRSQDQFRDRYESRSYGRPESDSRRSSDRDQSDFRSRRSQDENYDRDRQQPRTDSRSRYQNEDEDYRSSRDRKSDEDDSDQSSRNNNSKKNERNNDSDDSDDSDEDRPPQ